MGSETKGYVKAGRVIKILAWIGLVMTLCIGVAVGIGASASGKASALAVIGIAAFTLICAVLCYLQVQLGKAVQEHKDWARTVAIILYALQLLAFPLGTLIGAYVLYQLSKGWDEPKAPETSAAS